MIAAHIIDLDGQRRALANPDLVRLDSCPTCGDGRMHVHSRPERKLRGHSEAASVKVLVFRCSRSECGAIWRVLPRFLARHLWRAWKTVEEALTDTPVKRSPVPARTRQRWRNRLREYAAVLVSVLGDSGQRPLVERATDLGSGALRHEVIETFGGLAQLPVLAELVHRLVRGVRVM